MNVFIKTSLYVVRCILNNVPTEIEVNLTPTLERKLIASPLIRYNKTDYICKRLHVDRLILQVNKPKTVVILPVQDYFVRCSVDPRQDKSIMPKLVFRII